MTDISQQDDTGPAQPDISVGRHAVALVIVCLIGLVANLVGPGKPFVGALVGLIILYAIALAGVAVTRYIPIPVPSVAWITLIGIVLTIPGVPGSDWIVSWVSNVDFLALATPCLAYAGIAIAEREIRVAKRSGWKLLLVAIFVMTGTYLGSALIAEAFL